MARLEQHESLHQGRALSSSPVKQKERQPLEDMSRDQLYRRAVELDIDGRSKMTKAQLLYALRYG